MILMLFYIENEPLIIYGYGYLGKHWDRLCSIKERNNICLSYNCESKMKNCKFIYYIVRTYNFHGKMDNHSIFDPHMLDLHNTVIDSHFDLIG